MLLPNVYNLGYSAGASIRQIIDNHTLPNLPSVSEAWTFIINFPSMYRDWWLNLVYRDPIHVFVETTLLLSVVYMILSKRKDWRQIRKEKLTEEEQDELVREWRDEGRAPLVPSDHRAGGAGGQVPERTVVVHAIHGRTMGIQNSHDDESSSSSSSNSSSSSSSATAISAAPPGTRPTSSKTTKTMTMTMTRKTVLNFATHDFLGISNNAAVKESARMALTQYGCGSCGPRGFYGTIDVHLQLEDAVAAYTQTDGAIMYSDGASTASSTVAAFAKRGDLLVVDEGVYEPLVTGVTLSRANVVWFRHNDMHHLRHVLEEIARKDRIFGRKPNDQRRFIVAEGLYKNSGTIAPLDELVALKHEFHYRLILDESFSFGTLGPTGRGVVEKYGKKHMCDAEIVLFSLENALGSIGGVAVGNEEIVDHQRLSGAGYCFSASSPPFTASAAIAALGQLQSNDFRLLNRLHHNTSYLHQKVAESLSDVIPRRLSITSDKSSPIVFFELSEAAATDLGRHKTEEVLLSSVERACLESGVAVVAVGKRRLGSGGSRPPAPPALRLIVSASHTEADIDKVLDVLGQVVLILMP